LRERERETNNEIESTSFFPFVTQPDRMQ